MTKPLISLFLLALTLPLGCTVEKETPPDPLATRSGFCKAWAESACQPTVLDNCAAKSAEACQDTQSDFCLGIIPESYTSKLAKQCLAAVKAAYKDGVLTADDLAVVIQLGAPCDQLSKGIAGDGESCEKNDDCNTAGGFTCIIKQGAPEGTCGKPEEVGGGDACDGPTQVCEAGYFCDGENCIAYKKTATGMCEGNYQCKPEDRCVVPTDATSGTCEARADLSEDCTSDQDCQSGYCAIASKATSGICASKVPLSPNEALCDNLR